MPAKKKSLIRVGVLGQGRSGLDIHCRYFKTASRKFQIVAVSDLLRDRRQRAEKEIGCATYANYRDLIARDDLDLVVVVRPKEVVRQRDVRHALQRRIVQELRVDDKQHGHVDFFPGLQPLFIKAKALDLDKIRTGLGRHDIVRRDARDRLVAVVGRVVVVILLIHGNGGVVQEVIDVVINQILKKQGIEFTTLRIRKVPSEFSCKVDHVRPLKTSLRIST